MTKVLELKFELTDNSSLSLTIQKPKSNLTTQQINAAMDAMINSQCIVKKGNVLVAKKEARFVERIIDNVVVN